MSGISHYWRKTRRLTAGLLVVWTLLTFAVNWFARELNNLTFLGFPVGFYIGAQGILFLYLFIIIFYNRKMRALEAQHGVEED